MYERILVPMGGSATGHAGVDEAIKLAKLTGGRVRLLHVVDRIPLNLAAEGHSGIGAQVIELLCESGRKMLDEAHKRVADVGVAVDEKLFDDFEEPLCSRVREEVQDWGADVVVLGMHGRRRGRLGSSAQRVVRTSPVPVLLVPSRPR